MANSSKDPKPSIVLVILVKIVTNLISGLLGGAPLGWRPKPGLRAHHPRQGCCSRGEFFWIGNQNNHDIDYNGWSSSPQFFPSSDSDPWLQWWAVQQWGCCGINFQHLFHLPCYCLKQITLVMMILNDHMISQKECPLPFFLTCSIALFQGSRR